VTEVTGECWGWSWWTES